MAAFDAEVLTDAPEFYVELEETTGQHVDKTASAHTSTTVQVTAQGSASPGAGWAGVGNGDDFDGTDDYVSWPDSGDFFPGAQGSYSVMWCGQADTIDSSFRRIAAHEVASDGWVLSVQNNGVQTELGWRFERKAASVSTYTSSGFSSGTVPTTGQTYMIHAVCLVTAANVATFRVYVDGALAHERTGLTIGDMADPSAPLVLGRRNYDATRFFDGKTFAFAYFPSALSAARIQAHYDARNTTASAAQTVRPDADLATTGWTTTPLFSKVNDQSDATVVTATASGGSTGSEQTTTSLPTSIISSSGFSSVSLANIDEDPDSPDGAWAVASANNVNTVARVEFPTPAGNPTGVQTFKIYVRKNTANSGNPTAKIDLYQGATLVASGSSQSVTSTTGQMLSQTFDLASTPLPDTSGAAVRAEFNATAAGGGPSVRNSVDLGAINWDTTRYLTAPTPGATSVARVSLASGATPATRTLHSATIRGRKTNGAHTGTLRVRLYEGATARSAEYETTGLTTSLANYTLPLSNGEAAAITDYSDLELRVSGYAADGHATVFEVAELSLEFPAAAGGGSTLTQDLSDTLSLADALARAVQALLAGDAAAATDDSAAFAVFVEEVLLDDSVSLADLASPSGSLSLADSFALADAILSFSFGEGLADAASLSDALEKLNGKGVADTLSLSDGALWGVGKGLVDNTTVSDSASTEAGKGAALADASSVTDAQAFGRGIASADAASTVDDQSFGRSASLADSSGISDSQALGRNPALSDSLALSDLASLQRGVQQAVADSLSVTDSVVFTINKQLTETLVLADVLFLSSGVGLADVVSLSDAASSALPLNQLVDDVLVLADARSLIVDRAVPLADGLSLSDASALARAVAVSFNSGLTLADLASPARGLDRALADSAGLADIASTARAVDQALGDAGALADSAAIARAVAQGLADNSSLSDFASPGGGVLQSIADSSAVADSVAMQRALQRALADAPSVTDVLILSPSMQITEALGLSDALARGVQRIFGEGVALTDSVSTSFTGQYIHLVPPGEGVVSPASVEGLVVAVVFDGTVSVIDATGLVVAVNTAGDIV